MENNFYTNISNLAEILLVSANHILEISVVLKHGIQRKYGGGFVESRTLKSLGAKGESSEEVLA